MKSTQTKLESHIICPACFAQLAEDDRQEAKNQKAKQRSEWLYRLAFCVVGCALLWLADRFGLTPAIAGIACIAALLQGIVSNDGAARAFGAISPFLIGLGAFITVVLL